MHWLRAVTVKMATLGLLAGCTCEDGCDDECVDDGALVDPSVRPSVSALSGLDGGAPRPVGAMRGAEGGRLEFVANEIVLHPEDEGELDEFLERYEATVLRDGTPLIDPSVEPRAPVESSGWYLLRIDPSRSTTDDLAELLEDAGIEGSLAFSSDDAARTAALYFRERARGASLNPLMYPHATFEHPLTATTNLDAERFTWFTEDDSPTVPGEQGLSTGVVHAWERLGYHGILEQDGPVYLPKIAIIDAGFDLIQTTGLPANGNLDYGLTAPIQYDLVDHDLTAGAPNVTPCSAGTPCPWHGQGSFGIAAARPGNAYGSAGVGGKFVRPMLIRAEDAFTIADGIRSAVQGGADVISISSGGTCYPAPLCPIPPNDLYTVMLDAVRFARSFLTPVVTSAGNEGVDVEDAQHYPCLTEGTICVGSVDQNKMNQFNYGDAVDIWAPTNMLSTVIPDTAAADSNDVGADELYSFGGTSASTPFVAGAVALLKAVDPGLSYEEVLSILQSTANASPDPKVPHGYVDVFEAVHSLLPNDPPTISISYPDDGAVFGWKNQLLFEADYEDPEVSAEDLYRFAGEVIYTSSLDGELCRSSSPPYTCTSTVAELQLGIHTIRAEATDAFGATAFDEVTIEVVNRAPAPEIIRPFATEALYSHIAPRFVGFVVDPDESIPDADLAWESSIDGALGTGRDLTADLSAGAHTITLTATDGHGQTGQDQMTVTVLPAAGLPSPQITGPDVGVTYAPGMALTLEGNATDPEDGALTGASLEWHSDIDGLLGTGETLEVILSGPAVPCNPAAVGHNITLTARDSDGNEVTVQIRVWIGIFC